MNALQIHSNYSLKNLNTFGLNVSALRYFKLNYNNQFEQAIEFINSSKKHMFLGGGSNVLFLNNYNGLIAHIDLKGIEIVDQNTEHVFLKVGAGEIWHETVLHCINNGWGGIENLSLIPGYVGAAPMQNIGAYGVELKDVFYQLEAVELATGKTKTFNANDCNFGYRESYFKRNGKNKFFISSVTLKLNRNPIINVSYGAIQQQLALKNIDIPTIKNVSDAVISIRQSKLPNPAEIGNAGSFFKNPVINSNQYDKLKSKFDAMPCYQISDTEVKVPAGWLIENRGWKGKTFGNNYGVHKMQALVLVNYGGTQGQQIFDLSTEIIKSVEDAFEITLEREVNVIS